MGTFVLIASIVINVFLIYTFRALINEMEHKFHDLDNLNLEMLRQAHSPENQKTTNDLLNVVKIYHNKFDESIKSPVYVFHLDKFHIDDKTK